MQISPYFIGRLVVGAVLILAAEKVHVSVLHFYGYSPNVIMSWTLMISVAVAWAVLTSPDLDKEKNKTD